METQISVKKKNIQWISQEYVLLYTTLVVFILFSITAQGFFDLNNFFTILRSMSIITLLAVGITFVITAGEIDLSIGTLPALCGATLAVLLQNGLPLLLAFLLSFASALIIGLINGLIIVNTELPSIIITLATNMIASGLAYIFTNQHAIIVSNQTFLNLFGQNVFGFPVIVLWMVVLVILGYILLHFTKFGRNIAFIGDNKSASYFAGIKVGKTLTFAFILCSFYSFMAGMLGVAQAANATPWMISENMLTAIAATLIGGTAMAGGKGNILGTIVGAFFLTLLTNGFLIFGIEQWVLYLINGVIIIVTLSWRYISNK
jgi:ribose transport system permease protein